MQHFRCCLLATDQAVYKLSLMCLAAVGNGAVCFGIWPTWVRSVWRKRPIFLNVRRRTVRVMCQWSEGLCASIILDVIADGLELLAFITLYQLLLLLLSKLNDVKARQCSGV